jgi:hypothetical protein
VQHVLCSPAHSEDGHMGSNCDESACQTLADGRPTEGEGSPEHTCCAEPSNMVGNVCVPSTSPAAAGASGPPSTSGRQNPLLLLVPLTLGLDKVTLLILVWCLA